MSRALNYRSIAALALMGAVVTATACSRGFLYRTAPPLMFDKLDYGLVTKQSRSAPHIAYIDAGSPEARETLVLIHGLATNAGYFRYNIPELARQFRVIAVDLPGFGRSEKSARFEYTLSFYVESLGRLLREIGVERAVLVGHSMGGQIAMLMALKEPAMVSKLILLDPAGIESFLAGEGSWLRNALTIRGMTDVPEDGIRRNLAQTFGDWRPEWEWMVEERARMAKSPDFAQFANAVVKSVGAMLDEPTSGRLHEIMQETLIIYGERDGLIPNPYLHPGFPASVFETGAKRFPRATAVAVPRAGHMVHVEAAARVNGLIARFLAGTGAAGEPRAQR